MLSDQALILRGYNRLRTMTAAMWAGIIAQVRRAALFGDIRTEADGMARHERSRCMWTLL